MSVCVIVPSVLFQSTLPRGERLDHCVFCYDCHLFQSTLPRGERPAMVDCCSEFNDFNPRSREGSDGSWARFSRAWVISIHAPARGATTNIFPILSKSGISIHAPARGATCFCLYHLNQGKISIHAPARGATTYLLHSEPLILISIPAPARGATSTPDFSDCV